MPKLLKRTVYCGELRLSDAGKEVVVCGWVQRQRDLGSIIFIDLRDRTGVCQLLFDENESKEIFDAAFSVRSEYVLGVRGIVRERSSKNPNIPTGDVEIVAREMVVYNKALTPPFGIDEAKNVNDTLRLKYRYLELRAPDMQKNLFLRHKAAKIARDYFDEQGFLEIETPMLTKSTPEGARDYLVPSRVHPGKFYALPQSPQIYKQILMLSGYDRYFQIARCFRDEDLRADRQPEFTQIDLEMSFVDENDVMGVNEGFIKRLFKEALDVDVEAPFPRLPYREAMARYGSDKPDTRFALELSDVTDIVRDSGFKVFDDAASSPGFSVRGINARGLAEKISRKEIDSLTEFVKTYGARGLVFMKIGADGISSPIAKFLSAETLAAVAKALSGEPGDILFLVADKEKTVLASLGALRCEIAKRCHLTRAGDFKFLWVTQFPLFEYDEEEGRYVAMHHPFTSPVDEDVEKLTADRGNARAKAYDIVLNGVEVGGGSIRIHSSDLQGKMFDALGFSREAAEEKFGFLLGAFKFGAPPHGGMAYGLDRLVMLMAGCDSIRDVIAFPKVQNACELMMNSPDVVEQKQLDELSIKIESSGKEGKQND